MDLIRTPGEGLVEGTPYQAVIPTNGRNPRAAARSRVGPARRDSSTDHPDSVLAHAWRRRDLWPEAKHDRWAISTPRRLGYSARCCAREGVSEARPPSCD